ncbi:MAG TPA: aspartate ammonia-lyase [Candidatus Limnocylindrales bacterium]|nr:aspartate ammonia-lyase [Candidatus Limnocylindrales bacterium]
MPDVSSRPKTRIERDSLGTLEVPSDAYYGVQTARAVQNFPISGERLHIEMVRAAARIKIAAARANMEVKALDRKKGEAIVQAAEEVLAGRFDRDFVVDAYQAGAGTSFHMNVNEVIANRACEILGGKRGDHALVSPNDDVNMAQSTNDVIPTAMRLAAYTLSGPVHEEMRALARALGSRAEAFSGVLKSGRTHLQDAVPVTLGQEFSAYAATVEGWSEWLGRSRDGLLSLGLGGNAAGTGINAHPEYRSRAVEHLAALTGAPFRPAENLFDAMQSMAPFVRVSSVLRGFSLDLTRIANDLRLLASGPTTGFNEINLPTVQPGSSIMPGKVNPVMLEMTNMVCYQVIGYDTTVAYAGQAGQLELNVMMPVIAHNLTRALAILAPTLRALREKCIDGITANEEVCRRYFEHSTALATALNPYIGYLAAAEIAKESAKSGKTVVELVREKKLLTEEQIAKVFSAKGMTNPGGS